MNLKNFALGLALAIGTSLSGAALAGDRHHDRDRDRGHHSWQHNNHHGHGHHWRGHGYNHHRYGHTYHDRVIIREVPRPVYYERDVYYEPAYYPRRPAVVIGVDIPPVRIPF
jgi:hypothetical protein